MRQRCRKPIRRPTHLARHVLGAEGKHSAPFLDAREEVPVLVPGVACAVVAVLVNPGCVSSADGGEVLVGEWARRGLAPLDDRVELGGRERHRVP